MSERTRSMDAVILARSRQQPQWGQARLAAELRSIGVEISPSGVRKIWLRNGVETAYKRLKSIEREGGVGKRPALTALQREQLRRGDQARRVQRDAAHLPTDELPKSQVIIHAAAAVFVEQGFAGASLRDIADRAGLLAGSLYHHFPSKQALFVAVHHEGFRRLILAVREAVRALHDPWDRVKAAAQTHASLLLAGDAVYSVTALSLFSQFDRKLQRRLTTDRRRYEQLFAALVAELPLARGANRSLFRLGLLGALNWALTWYKHEPDKLSPAQIAGQFVDLLRPNQEVDPLKSA